MTNELTLYKLIILYMLKKANYPLTNAQLSEFILDKEYTTYFKLQQAISEMIENNLMREEGNHKQTLYYITEPGLETLECFSNQLSTAIIDDIDAFFMEKGYQLFNEVSTLADYHENPDKSYEVRCRIMEKKESVAEIRLSVPSLEEAKNVCHNWQDASQEIYEYIMMRLLQKN